MVTAWIYAPTVDFGFFWDDPLWFVREFGKPVWRLLAPAEDYRYDCPAYLMDNRLSLSSEGTCSPALIHAAQIGRHLLGVALLYTLGRRPSAATGWRPSAECRRAPRWFQLACLAPAPRSG
jgi:hypothetical protein